MPKLIEVPIVTAVVTHRAQRVRVLADTIEEAEELAKIWANGEQTNSVIGQSNSAPIVIDTAFLQKGADSKELSTLYHHKELNQLQYIIIKRGSPVFASLAQDFLGWTWQNPVETHKSPLLQRNYPKLDYSYRGHPILEWCDVLTFAFRFDYNNYLFIIAWLDDHNFWLYRAEPPKETWRTPQWDIVTDPLEEVLNLEALNLMLFAAEI